MELLDPTGTINRGQWWARQIIGFIIGAILVALNEMTANNPLLSLIVLVALAINSYFMIINDLKRLRDTGNSPWMIFIAIIPVVGWIALIWLCGITPSQNRLG